MCAIGAIGNSIEGLPAARGEISSPRPPEKSPPPTAETEPDDNRPSPTAGAGIEHKASIVGDIRSSRVRTRIGQSRFPCPESPHSNTPAHQALHILREPALNSALPHGSRVLVQQKDSHIGMVAQRRRESDDVHPVPRHVDDAVVVSIRNPSHQRQHDCEPRWRRALHRIVSTTQNINLDRFRVMLLLEDSPSAPRPPANFV